MKAAWVKSVRQVSAIKCAKIKLGTAIHINSAVVGPPLNPSVGQWVLYPFVKCAASSHGLHRNHFKDWHKNLRHMLRQMFEEVIPAIASMITERASLVSRRLWRLVSANCHTSLVSSIFVIVSEFSIFSVFDGVLLSVPVSVPWALTKTNKDFLKAL